MSKINGKKAEDWIEENRPENGLFRAYWAEDGEGISSEDKGFGNRYEWHYKDGKQHGISKGWNQDGTLKHRFTWKDGKSIGLYSRWYLNGQKSMEGNYKDGKEKDLIAAVPRIKGVYGWDYLGKSYTYIGEASKGSKQHPSNFTLVYFNIDIVVANKYLIDRLKEGKEKENEIKDYEKYIKDYRYISWHEKWKKKQKKIDKKSKKKKEDQLAKEKKKKEEEKKKEEKQLLKKKKEKDEEKTEKKEVDDDWF